MSASAWQSLLREPSPTTDAAIHAWFDAVAGRLLGGCQFLVADIPHRLTEIEFYFHGTGHLDPFAHCNPTQKDLGRWYFHKSGGGYRGGSFKGIDLTFGSATSFGGILFRGLEDENGRLVDGPSLCVDHLLRLTRTATVAALDFAIAGRFAWEENSPLHLRWIDPPTERPLLRTARVGLSLRRLRQGDDPPRFILRRYRYLAEPRRTRKGKAHMVLALHADGLPPGEISARTGVPRAAVARHLADFAEGLAEPDFTRYLGLDLGPRDLGRLHGLWHARHGPGTGG